MGKIHVPLNEYQEFYNVFARTFYKDVTSKDILPRGKDFWKKHKNAILKIFDGTTPTPEYLFGVLNRKIPKKPNIRSVDIPVLKKCLEHLGYMLPERLQSKNLEQRQIVEILWDQFKEKYIDQKKPRTQKQGKTVAIPAYYEQIYNRIYWFYKDLENGDPNHLLENLLSPNFRYRNSIKANTEKYKEILLYGLKVEFAGGMVFKEWRSDLVEAEVIMARYVETKLKEKFVGDELNPLEGHSIVTYKKELLYRLYNFTFICINNYWFIEDIGSYKILRGESLYLHSSEREDV